MHIRKSGRGMTEGNIAPAISRAGDRLVQRPPDSDRGGALDQVDDLRARASEVLDPNASATLFRESDPPGNVRISANITACWQAKRGRSAETRPDYTDLSSLSPPSGSSDVVDVVGRWEEGAKSGSQRQDASCRAVQPHARHRASARVAIMG